MAKAALVKIEKEVRKVEVIEEIELTLSRDEARFLTELIGKLECNFSKLHYSIYTPLHKLFGSVYDFKITDVNIIRNK